MISKLRTYWPSGLPELVIQAAFHSDPEVAQNAWRRWQTQCDFENEFWGDVRVASYAYRRLGRSPHAQKLEPRLGGLRRYIWATGKMRVDEAVPLLRRYAEGGVNFMPIKGSALLARNAQAVSDRFIADVDVLVEQADWEKAVDIALQDGWSTENGLSRDTAVHRMWQTSHSLALQRGKQGAVDLHYFSLRLNRQLGADADIWKRAMPGSLGGVRVILPHPSDHLVIVFGHCFLGAETKSYEWVSDALATISSPGFDWDLFTDAAIQRELAVPAAAALTFLAESLKWPIPKDVLTQLSKRVREPFLSEFAASRRKKKDQMSGREARATYQVECLRSKRSLHHYGKAPRHVGQSVLAETRSDFANVPAEQRIDVKLPPILIPSQHLEFRLTLEFTDLPRPTHALAMLKCCDGRPLELKRWLLFRPRSGRRYLLTGKIDCDLLVARGIDRLWIITTIGRRNGTTLAGTFESGIALSPWETLTGHLAEYPERIYSAAGVIFHKLSHTFSKP